MQMIGDQKDETENNYIHYNRIFFFYWKDNKFVLVHYYIKKSQKALKKEIKKAMKNIKDWIGRNK